MSKRRIRKSRPIFDALERRTVMTVNFGFTNLGGGNLVFDIVGDDAPTQILIGRDSATNDVEFQANTELEADGIFTPDEIEASGTVSAGDIALAQLITGATFRGFRLLGGGGGDIINASGVGVTDSPLQYSALLQGGVGNDVLTGGNAADRLEGGADNDTLNGNRRDVGGFFGGGFSGGTGNDTLNVLGPPPAGTAVFTIVNTDLETVNGSTASDLIDNSGFTDTSTATLIGGVQTVSLAVNAGDGNDTIVSGPAMIGAVRVLEALNGGAGIDTISYAASNAAVTVNLNNSTASGGFATGDTLAPGTFENVTGSAFDDTLRGSGVANVLNGGAGNDEIDGLAGNDTINGGAGDDDLSGGADNDTINGDAGNDLILGNAGDDVLTGGADVDQVFGNTGNDTINIPWADVVAMSYLDSYEGNGGVDSFQFTGVPAALSAADFNNQAFDYLELLQVVFGLTDFGVPDVVTRVNA